MSVPGARGCHTTSWCSSKGFILARWKMFSWQLVSSPIFSVFWLQSECSPSFGTDASRLFSLLSPCLPSTFSQIKWPQKLLLLSDNKNESKRICLGTAQRGASLKFATKSIQDKHKLSQLPPPPSCGAWWWRFVLQSVVVMLLLRSPSLQFNKHN